MLYVFAIFLPPVAVAMTGRMGSLLVNIILTLCFWLPGVIHALAIVGETRAKKRNRELAALIRQG